MRWTVAMMSLAALSAATAFPAAGVTADDASVFGRVTSDGKPVAYASVGVRGTPIGAAADEDGRYRLPRLRPGTYTIVVSAVGFGSAEATITLSGGEAKRLDFTLKEAVLESEGIVVTGTMKEAFVSESPVKVSIVSSRYLEKVPTSNVMEVIQNVNGLYQQIDCGVCYTNNIRINGMEGPYTAVLIDGMPVMSALASVYGLNGINPALIQQIEVMKGPASTLYGTEAMAGVINIITRRPALAPRLSVQSYATSDREMNLDVSAAPGTGRFRSLLSANVFHMDHFTDDNGDGFSDVPLATRLSLFGKGTLTNTDGMKVLDLSSRYYYEDRFGGVAAWTPSHRGSDEVYGEFILTHRWELLGSYRPARSPFRLDFAFNDHDQESYYGDVRYDAHQQVLFSNLIWNRVLGGRHDLLLGATFRYQTYDDNTTATPTVDRRFIPGLFAQHEIQPASSLRLLTGLRMDHHAEHGFIVSPRLSAKYAPGKDTAFRLNTGTGFRVVNLFTEDHAALTGAREVVIDGDLAPERSYSVTLNANHILPFGANPLVADVDVFYTRFSNQIIPDYDSDPNQIRYANLEGRSVSRGVALTLSQSFTTLPLTYTAGVTLMDVFAEQGGQRRDVMYAPDYQGVLNATYRVDRWDLSLDYTANFTGPMRLPAFDEPFTRPTRSTPFSIHNLRLAKTLAHVDRRDAHIDVDVFAALKNAFDYVQPSPLIDPAHPFGEHFDTAYVYAPLQGRTMAVGFRLEVR